MALFLVSRSALANLCADDIAKLTHPPLDERVATEQPKPPPVPIEEARVRLALVEATVRKDIAEMHWIGRKFAEKDFNKIMREVFHELDRDIRDANMQDGNELLLKDYSPATQKAVVSSIVDSVLAPYETKMTLRGLGVSLGGPIVLHLGFHALDLVFPGAGTVLHALQPIVDGTSLALAWPLFYRIASGVKRWVSADSHSTSLGDGPLDPMFYKIGENRAKRVNDIVLDGRNVREQAWSHLGDVMMEALTLAGVRDAKEPDKPKHRAERHVAIGIADFSQSFREITNMDKFWAEREWNVLDGAGLRTEDSYNEIVSDLEEFSGGNPQRMVRMMKFLDLIVRPDHGWKEHRAEWLAAHPNRPAHAPPPPVDRDTPPVSMMSGLYSLPQ